MDIRLEPKQGLAFQTEATEVLYGGAAGGGKSFLMRVSAIRWCVEVPGIQVYLFRRTLPDLRDNHLRGPTSFQVMLDPYSVNGHVKYRAVENEFEFWNGSVLHLCYCDTENDVEKYRGAEIHVLLMDELTHFTEYQYRFLRSRVRIAGLTVSPEIKPKLPRIECASNPGSIGHAWVKRTFIAPSEPLKTWKASPEEGGMMRQFIPARLSDNPYLTKEDPAYADRLRGLGATSLVRAMLDGDWDIIAGQAFEKLSRNTHCIEPFEPPEDWLVFGSLDWGSSKPFSFGLWTVANGNQLPDGRLYRRGAIIRFNELYGWTGKPNEGQRKEATEVADLVKSRIGKRKISYIASDPSMWKVDGGPSIAETMLRRGVVLRKADHNRLTGYVEVRQRIAGDGEGPMLLATSNCHAGFWRTMPDIVLDEDHPEDVDCWVAGTMISTVNGDVPIERIRAGDSVHTPIGPRIVEKSYISGPSETMVVTLEDGRRLQGTAHHKVYVDGIGLVPLSELKSRDSLIERNTPCMESLLYTKVSTSGKQRRTDTSKQDSLCIASSGSTITERFLLVITSITRTTTEAITESRILNALMGANTPDFITAGGQTLRRRSVNGQIHPEAETSFARILKNAGLPHRSENLRATIVASLLKLGTRPKNPVPKNATRGGIGMQRIAQFAARLFSTRSTIRSRSKPVRIVAVGRCEEKTPVYNLTVNEAHLFYANGFLSSNTEQEDHCYDDVRYACVSRPWATKVEEKKPRPERWLRFEQEEEATWRTA